MSLPWSTVHQKKYLWLYIYMVTLDECKDKQLKQYNYLLKFKKRNLINIIQIIQKWGVSIKESIYVTIARWLHLNDSKSNCIQQFKTLGHEQKQ